MIKSSLKIASPDKKTMEVTFKYERLGPFCQYCSHIGYENRSCPRLLEDKVKGVQKEDRVCVCVCVCVCGLKQIK